MIGLLELPFEIREVFQSFADIFASLPGILQACIVASFFIMCFFAIVKLYL